MWHSEVLQRGDTTRPTPAAQPLGLGSLQGSAASAIPQQEGVLSQRVTIPGHTSTGAIPPQTFHCGTWADTHHRDLGTQEGHSRVTPPCEDGVMVGMMKQSQCLNVERSKENIPIPGGRAGTAQWLL